MYSRVESNTKIFAINMNTRKKYARILLPGNSSICPEQQSLFLKHLHEIIRLDENTRDKVIKVTSKIVFNNLFKSTIKRTVYLVSLVHLYLLTIFNTYICSHFQCRCLRNDVDHSQEERKRNVTNKIFTE